MLRDLLFEIKCAEEIGAYKIADNLDKQLVKYASKTQRQITKAIEKTFNSQSGIKNVAYSNSQNKFIIEAEPSLPNSIKKEIKNIAEPYSVSFRYSEKNIDELISSMPDPIERHMKRFNPFGDYITLDEFENYEPTAQDLEMEEDVEPLSDDPSHLDHLLLEEARKQMKKHHQI